MVMKKRASKLLALLLALALVFVLSACKKSEEEPKEEETKAKTANEISDTMESEDGKYKVAMVTDLAQLKDGTFNEGTWNGVKTYAYENDLSYKYYQPANISEATDTDRYDAFIAAIKNGAEIVVAPGYLQEAPIKKVAEEYPDVKFIFIDGFDLGLDNVSGVSYHEEQSGYLSGYASVKDGLTKLGVTGGGGGTNPAVNRCVYGFAQGASAAAEELGVDAELKVSFLYGESYAASDALQTQMSGWYAGGTQVVLAYGGAMCNSVFAAASANNALSIGGDVDQSKDSDTVLTSALKGLTASTYEALTKFYDGKWDDIKGGVQMGIQEDAVGLPMKTSRFESFTDKEYKDLVKKMKAGDIKPSDQFENFLAGNETLAKLKVDFAK